MGGGCAAGQGWIWSLRGTVSLCAAWTQGMSPSGIGDWGIKACLMLITDQNEKLWGGGKGRGAEVNPQQSHGSEHPRECLWKPDVEEQ